MDRFSLSEFERVFSQIYQDLLETALVTKQKTRHQLAASLLVIFVAGQRIRCQGCPQKCEAQLAPLFFGLPLEYALYKVECLTRVESCESRLKNALLDQFQVYQVAC